MAKELAAQSELFTALILAGRHSRGDETQWVLQNNKCYIAAAGTPILVRVIDALKFSHQIGRIIVVGDQAEAVEAIPALQDLLDQGAIEFMPSAASAPDSLLTTTHAISDPFPLLVTTGDNALLTAEIVDYFCKELAKTVADLSVAFTSGRLIQEKFPDAQRTYLPFKDDKYSSCNLFAFQTAKGLRAAEFWRDVIRHRKRPWRIIWAFGLLTIIMFFLRRPTLVEALDRASKRLGLVAKPINLPFPEAAIDVDKAADLELAEKILLARQ